MNDEQKSELRSRLHPDKPSSTFSSEIMKEIGDEPQRNIQLQSLLLRHAIEQTSVNFTENVLSCVKRGEFKSSIQPVISRKTWGVVAMASTILTVWILFSNPVPGSGLQNYFLDLGKRINKFVSDVPALI